jgi:hypothetical protein
MPPPGAATATAGGSCALPAGAAGAPSGGGDPGGDPVVGRCMLTVSNPELKARLVSALETYM